MTRSLLLKTSLVWALLAAGAFAADEVNKGKKDAAFLDEATSINRAEIRIAQLAVAQSTEPSIRQLAQEMIDDHTKANELLKELCGAKGLVYPTSETLSPAAQKKYDELAKLQQGPKFDKVYLSGLIDDHKKAIKLFEREFKYGDDAEFRTFATNTIPTLKRHLESAQALEKAFKERLPGT